MTSPQPALVLEGGGLRGIFTSGVLDRLMDEHITFPYVIGVSMGATNGVSFVSRQKGRSLRIPMRFLGSEWRYMSLRSLLLTGNLFGMEFLFDRVPNDLEPFDYETFEDDPGEFLAVLTDVETGRPEYISKRACTRQAFLDYLAGSISIPLISTVKKVGGRRFLDGGIADSIPVARAHEDGFDRQVVVLTQPTGFQKRLSTPAALLSSVIYRRYPAFVEAVKTRPDRYNEALERVMEEEAAGNFFVIRPESPIEMPRISTDKKKLQAAYDAGVRRMNDLLPALRRFLG